MLMNAVGWASFAPHVYEFSHIPFQVKEWATKQATGWAIPVTTSFVQEVDLWVSTELGNRVIKIGPNSHVLEESFLRLGLTEDGFLAVQFLDHIPVNGIIGSWNLEGTSDKWTFDTQVSVKDSALIGDQQSVRFDLGKNDIELGGMTRSDLEKILPTAKFAYRDNRLMLPCSMLAKTNGVALTIMVGGIPVEIRRIDEYNDHGSDLCGTNLLLGIITTTIGRSFLNQYDVLLDGRNRKLHVLAKGSVYPKPAVVKYRMDSQFRGATDSAWRWIPAPGKVKEGDFLITYMDTIFPQTFGVLCFFENCIDSLHLRFRKDWIGAPIVDIDSDGIEFSENYGWEGYDLRTTGMYQSILIEFRYVGLRMNTDWTESIAGERLEFYPVRDSKTNGEFTVPTWPPIVENGIRVRQILESDFYYLVGKTGRWLGAPCFQALDDKRIIVTAEKTSSECDRELELRDRSTEEMRIDFSAEICKYRQIDLGTPGYAFEPLKRASALKDELQFKIRGTSVLSTSDDGKISVHTWAPLGADRWSRDFPWTAEPVITLDPATRMITITPSGPLGWKYAHGWRIVTPQAAYLEFKPIANRVSSIGKLSLTDEFWEFVPATADSDGPQFTITKDTFWRKEKDGSLALLFEDVSGPIFNEPLQGVFVGIPTVTILDSGALVVRPAEGFRPTFNVIATHQSPKSLLVRFTPTEYAQFGSIPTKTGNSDEICGICHDELDPDETVAKTKCRHYYHLSCLRRIEQRVCPYCRTSLDF